MKNISVVLLAMLSSFAIADQKMEKIEALLEAQSIPSLIQTQIQLSEAQGEINARKSDDLWRTKFNLSGKYLERLESSRNTLIAKTQTKVTPDDVANSFMKNYEKSLTPKELDEVIKFYNSPLGRKEQIARRQAMLDFMENLQKANEPIVQKAVEENAEELKRILIECKCAK